MRLKVSEAAEYTGLENETLRYYESLGIVSPIREPESGYRIYDDWDLHFLMDTKWYRNTGLSLPEVIEIVRSDDLEGIVSKCERQESVLLREIQQCENRLKALYRHVERIRKIKANKGFFSLVKSPAIIYQRHMLNPDEKYIPKLQRWKALFPYVEHTFLMTDDELNDLGPASEPYFGFSMDPERALKFGIEPESPARYIAPQKAIYTIFEAKGRGSFISSFKEQVLKEISAERTISGGAFGNLIVRYHDESGVLHRLFETWVFVEK